MASEFDEFSAYADDDQVNLNTTNSSSSDEFSEFSEYADDVNLDNPSNPTINLPNVTQEGNVPEQYADVNAAESRASADPTQDKEVLPKGIYMGATMPGMYVPDENIYVTPEEFIKIATTEDGKAKDMSKYKVPGMADFARERGIDEKDQTKLAEKFAEQKAKWDKIGQEYLKKKSAIQTRWFSPEIMAGEQNKLPDSEVPWYSKPFQTVENITSAYMSKARGLSYSQYMGKRFDDYNRNIEMNYNLDKAQEKTSGFSKDEAQLRQKMAEHQQAQYLEDFKNGYVDRYNRPLLDEETYKAQGGRYPYEQYVRIANMDTEKLNLEQIEEITKTQENYIKYMDSIGESNTVKDAAKGKFYNAWEQNQVEELTPEEANALANDFTVAEDVKQIAQVMMNEPGLAAKEMAFAIGDTWPSMLVAGKGLGAIGTVAKNLRNAAELRKLRYLNRFTNVSDEVVQLEQQAAKATKATKEALTRTPLHRLLGQEIAEDVAITSTVGIAYEHGKGSKYGTKELLRDIIVGTGIGFGSSSIRYVKQRPKLTKKQLAGAEQMVTIVPGMEKMPEINRMMKQFAKLSENRALEGLQFKIRPNDKAIEFWDRDRLDAHGYQNMNPGYYHASGMTKDGSVTLTATSGPQTVMEETAHFVRDHIQKLADAEAKSDVGDGTYSQLEDIIEIWEASVKAEGKRRGLDLPGVENGELFAQVLTANMGYADHYARQGSMVPQIEMAPEMIKALHNVWQDDDVLKGKVFAKKTITKTDGTTEDVPVSKPVRTIEEVDKELEQMSQTLAQMEPGPEKQAVQEKYKSALKDHLKMESAKEKAVETYMSEKLDAITKDGKEAQLTSYLDELETEIQNQTDVRKKNTLNKLKSKALAKAKEKKVPRPQDAWPKFTQSRYTEIQNYLQYGRRGDKPLTDGEIMEFHKNNRKVPDIQKRKGPTGTPRGVLDDRDYNERALMGQFVDDIDWPDAHQAPAREMKPGMTFRSGGREWIVKKSRKPGMASFNVTDKPFKENFLVPENELIYVDDTPGMKEFLFGTESDPKFQLSKVDNISTPIFYSRMNDLIGKKFKQALLPSDFERMLKNKGISKEQIEWLGLDELIEQRKGDRNARITPDEVKEIVNTHGLQLKVAAFGRPSRISWEKLTDGSYMATSTIGEVKFSLDYFPSEKKWGFKEFRNEKWDENFSFFDSIEDVKKALEDNMSETVPTRHGGRGKWKLPGGKQYEEHVLFAPYQIDPFDIEDKMHFGDVGAGTNLGWARTQKFNIPDKGQTHHIEEIQSNRHQEARSKGMHKLKKDEPTVITQENKDKFNDILGSKYNHLGYDNMFQLHEAFRDELRQRGEDGLRKYINHFEMEKADAEWVFNQYVAFYKETNKVPFAPFQKNWSEMLMKMEVRHAVEDGNEYITWTPGKEQARRSSPGEYIETLNYSKENDLFSDNTYRIWSNSIDRTVSEKDLKRLLGNDIAEKIIEGTQNKKPGEAGVLENVDLHLDPKSFEDFYNKGGESSDNIANFADRFAKKYGSKVEKFNLTVKEDGSWDIDENSINGNVPIFLRNNDPSDVIEYGPTFKDFEAADRWATEVEQGKMTGKYEIEESYVKPVIEEDENGKWRIFLEKDGFRTKKYNTTFWDSKQEALDALELTLHKDKSPVYQPVYKFEGGDGKGPIFSTHVDASKWKVKMRKIHFAKNIIDKEVEGFRITKKMASRAKKGFAFQLQKADGSVLGPMDEDGNRKPVKRVTNVPQSMDEQRENIRMLVNNMNEYENQGKANAPWYQSTGELVQKMANGPKEDAMKLGRILGLNHHGSPIKLDMEKAVDMFYQYKRMKMSGITPESMLFEGSNDNILLRKVAKILKGQEIPGQRTNAFERNILNEVDELYNGAREADIPGDGIVAQHNKDVMESLANSLGTNTKDVQDMIQTAHLGRWSNGSKDELLGNVERFGKEDGFKLTEGQLSWMAVPGKRSGELQGIHEAPYETRLQYHNDLMNAMSDEAGNNIIAKELKIEGIPDLNGTPDVNMKQNPESMDAAAAMLGYFTKQDGVGWHNPVPAKSMKDGNVVEYVTGTDLRPEHLKELEKALITEFGAGNTPMIVTQAGPRFMNFTGKDNVEWQSRLNRVIERTLPEMDIERGIFKDKGNLITNNWREQTNGEGYYNRIVQSKSRGIFRGVEAILEPKIHAVNGKYQSDHGFRYRDETIPIGEQPGPGINKSGTEGAIPGTAYQLKRLGENPPDKHSGPGGQSFDVNSENWIQKLERRVANRFAPVSRIQKAIEKAGGKIAESEDVELAEILYPGRTQAIIEDTHEKFVKPVIEYMRSKKLTLEEVDDYLYAKHAREANEHIASINQNMPDGGSGMSNAEATEVLKNFQAEGKLQDLEPISQMVAGIREKIKQNELSYGLKNQATLDMYPDYKHYVPLRGFEDPHHPLADQGIVAGSRVQGFATNPDDRRRMGRTSRAKSPLSTLAAMLDKSIVTGEKNKVGKAFLSLVLENSDAHFIRPDGARVKMWEVDPVVMDRKIDQNGQVVYVRKSHKGLAPNEFTVSVEGEQHVVTMNNPELANAMKQMGSDNSGTIIKLLQKYNRFISMLSTSLNPEFVYSNFLRDAQTAGIHLAGDQGPKMMSKVTKDVPMAMAGAMAGANGRRGGTWSDWYHKYRAAGGKVGWFGMKSVEDIQGELSKKLGNTGKWGKTKESVQKFGQVLSSINEGVENSFRLAVFKNLVEAGTSEAKAAKVAKELTVNFNRKGEMGSTMNGLYLFFNASLQGMLRMGKAVGTNRKVQAMMGGIAVAGYTTSQYNYAVGGTDESGYSNWDLVPDYIKERNWVLMDPDGSGSYTTIPMPYGYNVPQNVGTVMSQAMNGNLDHWQAVKNLTLSTVSAFNPLGTQNSETFAGAIVKTLTPSIMQPGLQHVMNENFAGYPIKPENMYQKEKPESQIYYNSVRGSSKKVAETLNSATGGTIHRPGAIDVSPEVMDHYIDTYTGGLGKFATNSFDFLYQAYNGNTPDVSKIPFVRRMRGEVQDRATRNKFFEISDELEQIKNDAPYIRNHGSKRDKAKLKVLDNLENTKDELRSIKQDIVDAESRGNTDKVERLKLKRKKVTDRFLLKWREKVESMDE